MSLLSAFSPSEEDDPDEAEAASEREKEWRERTARKHSGSTSLLVNMVLELNTHYMSTHPVFCCPILYISTALIPSCQHDSEP